MQASPRNCMRVNTIGSFNASPQTQLSRRTTEIVRRRNAAAALNVFRDAHSGHGTGRGGGNPGKATKTRRRISGRYRETACASIPQARLTNPLKSSFRDLYGGHRIGRGGGNPGEGEREDKEAH